MRIDKSSLHPLYDQYSNEENRLTHALLHTIGSSRWLLTKFLKYIVGVNVALPNETYEISTQKVPFSQADNDPKEIESIPDAWIVTKSKDLGVAIEVKDRKNSLNLKQLRSHVNRIRKYKNSILLVITPDLKKPKKIDQLKIKEKQALKIIWHSWDEIHRWLGGLSVSKSSKRSKEDFLIVSMRDYLEKRREILGFQGIYFTKGFNVSEAKVILNSEMEVLEPFVRKLLKYLGERRPAITTFSKESVWDCFGSDEGFTKDLHITLGIHEKSHDISITVPNSAKQAWSRLKRVFSDERDQAQLFSILKVLRNSVPHLFIEFNQRHFITRKISARDGYMEFNIDTFGTPFRKASSKVKEFPIWQPAIKSAILNKKKINGQVMFKSKFLLNETKGIDKPQFINVAKSTIKAFKPLYKFLHKSL